MPEYLSPGVYVEEVDAGPVPIEGVSTSTSGAVGFTLRGPSTGKPLLVTSYTEFVRTFGGEVADPPEAIMNKWADNTNPEGGNFWQFPLSVKGFFDNGGQRMYVKRVFSSGAAAAAGMLGSGLVAEILRDSPDGKSLDLSHLFGIQNGTKITVWTGGTAQPQATVSWYDPQSNKVILTASLNTPIKAGRDFVVIATQAPATNGLVTSAGDQRLTFDALDIGAWSNGLTVRFRPMAGTTLKLAGDPTVALDPSSVVSTAYGAPTLLVTFNQVTGFSANDVVTIGASDYLVTNVNGGANQLTLQPLGASHADPKLDNTMTVTLKNPSATPATANVVSENSFTDGAWTVTVTDATQYAAAAHLFIGGEEYVVKSIANNVLTIDRAATSLAADWGVRFPPGTAVRRARLAAAAGATKIQVSGADQLYIGALVELDNGMTKDSPVVSGGIL